MPDRSLTQQSGHSGRVSHTNAAHHLYSTWTEELMEHVFVGEALRALWRRGVFDVEVLRSEFDSHGYDLVMVRSKVVRHIQFKTGVGSKTQHVRNIGLHDW